MWQESIILPALFMILMSVVFYKLSVQFLYDGQLAVMMWLAVGVPILVIALTVLTVTTTPPRSYAAIAGLVGLSNGMVGLGIKMLGMRLGRNRD